MPLERKTIKFIVHAGNAGFLYLETHAHSSQFQPFGKHDGGWLALGGFLDQSLNPPAWGFCPRA